MPKAKVVKSKPTLARSTNATRDSVSLILPYLCIGPASATSSKPPFIPRHGITHVISIRKRPESMLGTVTYLRLTIDDDPTADLSKALREVVAFIDKARPAARAAFSKSKVFVHCSAGISRSPAVIVFYLMHRCGMSLRRALGLIVEARRNACPNAGFVAQLQQVEVTLRGRRPLPADSDLLGLPSKKEERLAFLQEPDTEDTSLDDGKVEASMSGSIPGKVLLDVGKRQGKCVWEC